MWRHDISTPPLYITTNKHSIILASQASAELTAFHVDTKNSYQKYKCVTIPKVSSGLTCSGPIDTFTQCFNHGVWTTDVKQRVLRPIVGLASHGNCDIFYSTSAGDLYMQSLVEHDSSQPDTAENIQEHIIADTSKLKRWAKEAVNNMQSEEQFRYRVNCQEKLLRKCEIII